VSKSFEGKLAVITGAAGGMGLAFAQRFAAEGAALILADVDDGALARGAGDGRA
jgi:NAD(P)-dependent dehydrogenase (short-subunit alcohol dehydrogenase family)